MDKTQATLNHWPRGSEWRRWDLHVHSPASEDFSGDYNAFIIQLGNADCDVIGINDYFSVAGYREVLRRLQNPSTASEGNKAYRDSLAKLRSKTLIPVVECRMNNVLLDRKGSGPRINFHLIFDPAIDPENIETLLKTQKVHGSSIGTRYDDRAFLRNEVTVDFFSVKDDLLSDGAFKDRFLIWLPYDEYGGIGGINPSTDKYFKAGLIYAADILGSSNRKQANFFLWRDPAYSLDEYRTWFGIPKPCIKGSDSHDVNDEIGKLRDQKSKPTDKYCWIKADPTFAGLRQIVNEPADRVFIGHLPPKLEEVKANPTRFIDRLCISKTASADTADRWFDCEIPLNPDMVAVIGNKGSGKSALADILALAANTHCDPEHFSFLRKDRFCERGGRLAKQFEVRIIWMDGSESTRPLNAKPDVNDVESVRYIPQAYLEKVCTEMEPGKQSDFQAELRKVIFSHISDVDRLGKETLDELIEFRTSELKGQLSNAQREMARDNAELVRLEEKSKSAYRLQLEAKLRAKQQELKAHQGSKPEAVLQPSNATDEQKTAYEAVAGQLAAERAALNELDEMVSKSQALQKALAEKAAITQKVQGKLDTLEAEFERLERELEPDLKKLGLAFKALATLSLDREVLSRVREALATERKRVDADLDGHNLESVVAKRAACLERIAALQDELDAPNKRYQQYNEALRLWNERSRGIEGAIDKPDTLRWLAAQLRYIESDLPKEIFKLKQQRRDVAAAIHKCIAAIRDVYKEHFGAVQDLIINSVVIKEGFNLTFESAIVDRTFRAELFDRYVSQGNVGSFYGKEKGSAALDDLRSDVDFNDADQAITFVEKVIAFLEVDMRNPSRPATGIESQLRKNVDVKALYDFLWGFGYLEPEYSLKLDGKDLSLLSPGERGTLLLIFYLLVDKATTPIIVDQPEENLDSQTVYRLLIPVIKDVKRRRQIIMVTHSPNIAVVCDAEQIIHARVDRPCGNAVVYTMGAMEGTQMNRFVVDVLEGTRPAFDNREAKYYAAY